MSEDIIQHFKEVLMEDIVFAEDKLRGAMNLPVDDYAAGEIYLSKATAKHSRINEAEERLQWLKKIYQDCFPSLEYIRGIAEDYLWKKEQRKIT